jgi:hypothetical protein
MAVITNSIFEELPANWKCPSCQRNKSQIVRTKSGKKIAKVVKHHDHMKELTNDYFREKFGSDWIKQVPEGLGEFLNKVEHFTIGFLTTVICEDCNNIECSGRKEVKAPKYFSFAPSEIGQFIISRHGKLHQIRKDALINIYQNAQPCFANRLNIAQYLIQEAELGKFWKTKF